MNDDQSLRDFVAKYARPYDPESDDYDRPPFAADIKEGKNDPIYNALSYHTKVPPRSIIPYILHYTRPGDLILDPFGGSGMTGVAAQMCANPPADLLEQFPELKDRVGPRRAILNDLSPAACHIAYNYTAPVNVDAFKREFRRIMAEVKDEFDWLYGTEHCEPAVGHYDPKLAEVEERLKKPLAISFAIFGSDVGDQACLDASCHGHIDSSQRGVLRPSSRLGGYDRGHRSGLVMGDLWQGRVPGPFDGPGLAELRALGLRRGVGPSTAHPHHRSVADRGRYPAALLPVLCRPGVPLLPCARAGMGRHPSPHRPTDPGRGPDRQRG